MKNGEIAYLAFTERGRALAQTLGEALGGTVSCTRDGVSLGDWTAEAFAFCRALVYVGAAGIAVRAIAPHLVSKASDPAVIAVDECGRFAVPLASGHLGGANELARRIARVCGATAVITTATDANGVFAVDEWARVQGMTVADTSKIKAVSAKLLAGKTIAVRSAFPIDGESPKDVTLTEADGADVWVDVRAHDALTLVPSALALGIGCKRGTAREKLENRFTRFCEENAILPAAICAAATIDLKRDEEGLSAFCAAHGWTLSYYAAQELAALDGDFTPSVFVAQTTGVDNVCERAAVKLADGELTVKKNAGDGVTFALAQKDIHLDWRWQNG
ncbi:MAG: cobalamin biosynthesis protein CbiG [Ruminococcaceae bacterium]|nr:cobalamin biosynthesis protein CbiG [Oscillospiraceae bacterium]